MKIAIVGGGAAGVSMVESLLRNRGKVDITVYEPNEQVGPGQAYQADTHSALLNRQAGFMSVSAENPKDFVKWMAENNIGGQEDSDIAEDFLPRPLFGKYLNGRFNEYVKKAAKNGSQIHVVRDVVVDLDKHQTGQWLTTTSSGSQKKFDKVVLSPGTGNPENVYQLGARESYIDNPYPLSESMSSIHTKGNVLVLGTGLTAIDAYRTLIDAKHEGGITLASRRALLPSVRHPEAGPPPSCFTKEKIEELISQNGKLALKDIILLAKEEFKAKNIPKERLNRAILSKEEPEERLVRQLEEAKNNDPVEPLLNAMARPTTEIIWNNLGDGDRKRFFGKYNHVFNALRNPMPVPSAEKLLAGMRSGKLKVLGGLSNVQEDGKGYVVSFGDTTMLADSVVNTIRSEKGNTNSTSADLLCSMVKKGKAKWDQEFGGIQTDFDSNAILSANGEVQPGLYALGQLTKGSRYYTSSLEAIADRANIVASAILEKKPEQKAPVSPRIDAPSTAIVQPNVSLPRSPNAPNTLQPLPHLQPHRERARDSETVEPVPARQGQGRRNVICLEMARMTAGVRDCCLPSRGGRGE